MEILSRQWDIWVRYDGGVWAVEINVWTVKVWRAVKVSRCCKIINRLRENKIGEKWADFSLEHLGVMGSGIWGRAIKRGQERKAKELSHSKLRKMQCTRRQLDKVFFLIGKCSNCYGTSQNTIDWFVEKQCIKRKKMSGIH